MRPDDDLAGDVGPLDVGAMERIREEFRALDGLADGDGTGFDSALAPTVLAVELDDGVGDAEWCRFDVKWYRSGYYNVHHVDDRDVNFRFDFHPKPGVPDRHFHPPPDAPSDDAEPSCIAVEDPALVARAVHKLWRRAYETGSFAALNSASNPP